MERRLAAILAADVVGYRAHRPTISEKTIEIHRANVMQKMRVRSLASLVHMAVSLRDD